MNISKPVIVLCFIAVFCAYLIASAEEQADSTQTYAVVLSTPAYVSEPAKPEPISSKSATVTESKIPDTVSISPSMQFRTMWAIVTAYCPCRRCCDSHANGKTSTGTSAWKRGVAAYPGALAYGTKVFVDGYGFARIDDTGAAMRRTWRRDGMTQLDIRMNSHKTARKWGRRVMKVRVYDLEIK